jgi:hypothetical protein
MPPFPFPDSSTPGVRAGEGEGRYVNCEPIKEGDRSYVRRSPGLAQTVSVGGTGVRGMLDVNGVIYLVIGTAVKTVSGGTVTTLSGSISGTDGVTLARNNKTTDGVSTPDIVAVRESGGAYVLTSSTVSSYPDADLPTTVNSVDFMGGYFLFSNPDGRFYASELNSTDVEALSVTTAEARADGLRRVVVQGNIAYAMGGSTIEPYLNVGTSPFPLQRSPSVLPTGLLTTMAVTGFEEAWNRPLYYVASDFTVRSLSGYSETVVSTPDVQRFIAASTASSIEMLVFQWQGRGYVAISSNVGTWVLNVTSSSWHERVSASMTRWRAQRSVYSGGLWVLGDTTSGYLQTPSATLTEAGAALGGYVQSAPLKSFPANINAKLNADFTEASGDILVSWSRDGGKTFSTEVTRSLSNTERAPVSVSSLGRSTHHGFIVKLRWTGSADFAFMGATADRLSQGLV